MATVTAIDIKPAPEAEVTPVGTASATAQNESASIEPVRAVRRRLPDERLGSLAPTYIVGGPANDVITFIFAPGGHWISNTGDGVRRESQYQRISLLWFGSGACLVGYPGDSENCRRSPGLLWHTFLPYR